jgi:hypothetical protein
MKRSKPKDLPGATTVCNSSENKQSQVRTARVKCSNETKKYIQKYRQTNLAGGLDQKVGRALPRRPAFTSPRQAIVAIIISVNTFLW